MIRLCILPFFFLAGIRTFFTEIPKRDIPVKWYIRTDKNDPATFRVTIDATQVSRFIQLGDLRFAADFKDEHGNLISRDSIRFFQETASQAGYISGTEIITLKFKHPYGPHVKISGIRLFYVWDDTSMSLEPDPFGDKLIIESEVYGRDSADVSEPAPGN